MALVIMLTLRAYIVYIDYTNDSISFLETSGWLLKTTNPRTWKGRGLKKAQNQTFALLRLRLCFLIVFFILQTLEIVYLITYSGDYIAFSLFSFSIAALYIVNSIGSVWQLTKFIQENFMS